MHHNYLRNYPALIAFLTLVSMFFSVTAADLTTETNTILGLMDSGKSAEAAVSVNKLIADNSSDTEFAGKLFYTIAEKCRIYDKYEQEKTLYQLLAQNYPNSPYLDKAKLGLSRADVQTLILSGKYDQAKAAVAKIKSDFAFLFSLIFALL